MIKKSKMTHLLASTIVGVVIVLSVLLILLFTGVLNPQKTELTIVTVSSEALYDGNPLIAHSWQISEGRLKDGHKITATFTAKQTSVGESDNVATVKITDEVGADVTNDYRIRYEYGTLKVNPRVFRIESAADTKEYDEKPLRNPDYSVISDYVALADGHKLVVEVTGEITEIGATTNTIESFIIVDAKGNDVSYNYHVSTKEGILQVVPKSNKIKLTIVTGDARKIYDSTALTNDVYDIVSGKLDSDHTLIPTFTGQQTSAGESPNFMSVRIVDEKGKDVTDEYAVTYRFGSLQVDPRPIRINSNSASKTYDGVALQNKNYTMASSSFSLVVGHKLQLTITGKITDAGKVPNTVSSVKITDADKIDVTRNYQITVYEGTLEVLPRPIHIASDSAQKVYDGKPLTQKTYAILNGTNALVNGHTLQVSITGSITEPGIAANTISQIRIYGSNKTNVSHNYDISAMEGVLEIIVPGSGGSLADSGEDQEILIMELFSTVSSQVYLREKSFGDYNGKAWVEAVPYTSLLNNTYSMQYLPGISLKNNGVATATAKAKFHVSDLYLLPYFLSLDKTSYQIQTSDVYCYAADQPMEYELQYYPMPEDYKQYQGRLSPYAAQENAYSKFVYSHYLSVDPQTKAFMKQLIAEQAFSAMDPDIISKVASYIQNAATYNKQYPAELDQAENPVIAFLSVYKEGLCRHYASAATLLFRTLGIPARYTVGFAAVTVADEWIEVKTPGHAWVEIYIDDFGWIPVEVTPGTPGAGGGAGDCNCEGECTCDGEGEGSGSGSGNGDGDGEGEGDGGGGNGSGNTPDQKMKLQIKPVNVAKPYDGKPLYASNELKGLEQLLALGYKYSVSVKGMRTEYGITESTIVDLQIFNSVGMNVTDSFEIELKPGTIQIYHTELTVQSYNLFKTYDGFGGGAYRLTKGALQKGDTLSYVTTSPNTVGIHSNLFEVEIRDKDQNDVTDFYLIHYNIGNLEIAPRNITIAAGSSQKKYDGTALTNNEITITEGTLAPGHSIAEYSVIGSQVQVGRSDNVITQLKVVDENGTDVTANYQIVLLPGTLKVTMR